ncbi:MAG: ATP-binding protein [Alkalispirochaeta sp.]
MKTDVASLAAGIERFVASIEELVLEERGSQEQISGQLAQLREDARFFNADEVTDTLDEVSDALTRLHDGGTVEPSELLPLVFRLRDAAGELGAETGPAALSPGSSSFLEIDLQDEITAVLSISEEAERSLNSRVQAGQTPFLLVMRVDPERLDTVEEFLEAEYQILSYRRQDTTARIAAVVVEVVAPDVERAVDSRFGDRSTVKEVTVRPLDLDSLRVQRGLSDRWYSGLSPIAVKIDPASMERIWLLMDVLSPAGDDRMQPALWRELRRSIASSFTVELRDVLTDMQASLEQMAITAGKKIRVTVSGRGAAIGVEIAEPLRKVLFELISNGIIHGIEPPGDRRAQGKPEVGSIACYIQSEGQTLSVRISDDGRGFEGESVQHRGAGGLHRAREVVRDRLGGILRLRSGRQGVTAIVELPALQGVYRGLVVVRGEARIVIPSSLVVWAGEIQESRIVVDTTGSPFLRYQRQLIPLVEPEVRHPDGDRPDDPSEESDEADEARGTSVTDRGSPTPHSSANVPAVVVIQVAGQMVAFAVDTVQEETVVSTSPGGWLRLSLGADEWGVGIALQNLPLGK